MTDQKLLPCPFCGSCAEIKSSINRNPVLQQPVLMHPDYRSLREFQRGLNAGFSLLDNAMKGFHRSDKFVECVFTASAELRRMNEKIESELSQISRHLKSEVQVIEQNLR